MTVPIVRVYLDDGTGTFPYDISAWVRLNESLSISRGREDEFSNINPGSMSATLDNSDGRFTLGSPTYNIKLDQRIRVTINATTRFTGYVQRWPITWAGPGKVALSKITATDALNRLSRFTMRSLIEEEVFATSPAAYYTMGDASGSTAAADSSGNFLAPANSYGGGTAVVFGSAVGPPTDGLTAAQFADGAWLYGLNNGSWPGMVRASFLVSALPAIRGEIITLNFGSGGTDATYHSNLGITISPAGVVQGMAAVGPNVNDGKTHDVVIVWTGANELMYVDGALYATAAATGPLGPHAGYVIGRGFTGVVAHVAAASNATTAAQVTAMNQAAVGSHTTATYLNRIAALTGLSTGTIESSLTTLAIPNVAGTSAADTIQGAAEAEVGAAYIDAAGALTFKNRNGRPNKLTPDMTISTTTSECIGAEIELVADATKIINYATGKRAADGSMTQIYTNAASVVTHGRYRKDYTYWVTTDDEALQRVAFIVNGYAEQTSRIPHLALDALTASAAETTSILALDIGSRVRLSNLPSQAPSTTTDLAIEGWTETVSLTEWTFNANVTDWSLYTAWLLGDATYGVLGSTTKLYI